jgi:hypothetical protein
MNAPRSNLAFIDVDRLCHEAEEAGIAWADAKAAYEALEQTRKTVLSQGIKSHMGEGAFNKAEVLALADDGYLDFIKRMVHAGRAADRARVRYDILKTRIELLRTNASTERAAMSMR